MPKLRQKVSGGMRTLTGTEHFAALRSYIATTGKHEIAAIDALTRLTTRNPWIPEMTRLVTNKEGVLSNVAGEDLTGQGAVTEATHHRMRERLGRQVAVVRPQSNRQRHANAMSQNATSCESTSPTKSSCPSRIASSPSAST